MKKTILFIVMACLCHLFTHAQTSLTFDGVDDYTQVNYYSQLDLGTGDFTLEAMVSNLDFSLSDTLTILSQQNQSLNQGIRWYVTNNTVFLEIENDLYTANFSASSCTHLSVMKESGSLLFYSNSTLLGAHLVTSSLNATCTNCHLLMGKDVNNSNYFKGGLDEVRIWKLARSITNIASYETSCLDSAAMANSSLIGYWNFEESNGQFVNNLVNITNYARLGSTFYGDSNDPTWSSTSCISGPCYSTGLADFTLSDMNPKEGDLVTLTNTTIGGAVAYWIINGDTTFSVNSFQYAFPLGMNAIQLAVSTPSGITVQTILLTVTRPRYPCSADEYDEWRAINDPIYPITRRVLELASFAGASGNQYHIPVVFHVIADNQSDLNAFPIARIQAQLDTLNRYFSKDSTDITFCLAQNLPLDSAGITTWADLGTSVTPGSPGITYTLDTGVTSLFNLKNYAPTLPIYTTRLGTKLPFSPDNYLSIYIVDSIISPVPGAVGLSSIGPTNNGIDGMGIDYDAFVGGILNPLGKTVVHEVGHWLGLQHVFLNDGICDTYPQQIPTSDTTIFNCNTPYSITTTCPPNPVYNWGENHMDYHTEICRTVFTRGQTDRMHFVLDNGRPFIHSTLNLIGTGVQKAGGCLDLPNVTAQFTQSTKEICTDELVNLVGADIDYDYWEWGVSWDPAKNNGNPAPTTNLFIQHGSITGTNSQPRDFLSISAPGVWDIHLRIEHVDTNGGNMTSFTISDTTELTILDCSPNAQRNRVTIIFDSTDWQVSAPSIANLTAIPSDTLNGHIVTGTGFVLNQNSEGVIIRTDLLGRTIWRKSIKVANADIRLFNIASNVTYQGQNCIALTGHIERTSGTELLFIIIDRLGNVLFQESYSMNNMGSPFQFVTGLQVKQLSSAFNNQFTIVGFVGGGASPLFNKTGFILGLDPSLGIQWNHFFESPALTTVRDVDIAENITEISADFGSGLEPALVVGGSKNRVFVNVGSGVFISCLTVNGSVVTEQWRKNIESIASNPGTTRMSEIDYDNGRLFATCYNELIHGSMLMELNPSDGNFKGQAVLNDFYPTDLIIDGNYCVLAGKSLFNGDLVAAKLELPDTIMNVWNLNSAIGREYSDSRLFSGFGGFFNSFRYIARSETIVPSSNGGYMMVEAKDLVGNGVGLLFNKIDDILVSSCITTQDFPLTPTILPLVFTTGSDSIQLGITLGVDTISAVAEGNICYKLGCEVLNSPTVSLYEKCPLSEVVLNNIVPGFGPFSYLWSPPSGLDSITILSPTSSSDTTITHHLVVNDTISTCPVYEADAYVNVGIPFPFDLGLDPITICEGDTAFLTAFLAQNGNVNTSWFWNYDSIFLGNFSGMSSVVDSVGIISSTVGIPHLLANGSPYQVKTTLLLESNNIGSIAFCLTDTTSVAVQNPAIITSTDVSCSGTADGTATVNNVNCGIPPYTYLWSTNETTTTISGLSTGIYCVTITDSTGFSFVKCDTIEEPSPILSAISGNNVTCRGGSNGQATIAALGGTSPYSYLWSNSMTSSTITNLTAGLYTVTIADSNNCLLLDSITIIEPNPINITIDSFKQVSCAGINDGQAFITVTGGTAPYSYLWSTGETNSTATNLSTSINTVTVTDANNCTSTQSISLSQPPFLFTQLTILNATNCVYSNDGEIQATMTGGAMPFTYQWSNGQSNAIASGLTVGAYSVTITNSTGCSATGSTTLTAPVLPTATTAAINASCNGFADGQIATSVTGATAPYNYLWSNSSTNATATGLASGGYTLTISDVNGCTITINDSITEPSLLTTTLVSTNINCVSNSSGAINNTVSGGTSPYTYLWSNGATSQNISGLTAATYCVTVSDANGCTFTDCATIAPLNGPLSILKIVDKDTIIPYDTICYRILVTNNCQVANTIVVTDTLPIGLLMNDAGTFNYNTTTNLLIDTLTIAAGSTDTLAFKARVLQTPRCGNINSIRNQANAFELGNPSQQVRDRVRTWVQDTAAINCTPLLDTVEFNDMIQAGILLDAATAQTTNQSINITGTWRLDPGTTYRFTNGSVIRMSPGAQIIVPQGALLVLNNTTVRAACTNCMWQRILVQNGGTIVTRNNAILQGAQYAIQAEDGATLRRIVRTTFRNNFIGIYVAPNASNNITVGRFANNLFSATGILAPFVGAAATPSLDISNNTVLIPVPPTSTTNLIPGLAGILAWDLPALNLNLATPTLSNTFQRLVAGIVLFNSNFSTNSCSFNKLTPNAIYPANLAYQGCGIHVRAAGTLGLNNMIVEGCNFKNCFIGISGIGSGIQATNNQMDRIDDMGIRSIRLFNERLIARFNRFTRMRRLGVGVFDPLNPSDIWIDNNEISMKTVPGQGACVLINDSPITGAASTLLISNNTLEANQAENGIVVSNHNNAAVSLLGAIENNTITMRGASTDRAGISVLNSRLLVECNTIDGNQQTLNATNVFGIVGATNAILGGQSIFQCNAVDRTNVGVFFTGINNVDFKGNRFDRHVTGLLLASNAEIGLQIDNGNRWTGNTNEDAQNFNTAGIQNSEFTVDFVPNLLPNNIFAPTFPANWFNILPGGNTFNCNTPQLICGSPFNSAISNNTTPSLTVRDSALALGTFTTTAYTPNARYTGQRSLFRKLLENPNLQQGVFSNFVTTCQTNCIGHFDNVAEQCKQAFGISSMNSLALDSLKQTCDYLLDTLSCLDSMLAINYSNSVVSQRTAFAQQLINVSSQRQGLLSNINAQQQANLTPICNVNNSFSTVVKHELFEQQVNDIYLNTIAKEILNYNSSQLSVLRLIASDCPQEGGKAVHTARGMLSRVEDVNFLDFDCSSSLRSKPMKESNDNTTTSDRWELVLYPNPTDNELTVESNQTLENITIIEIYNSLGQQVRILTIEKDIQSINLDASSLLDGVYIMRLKNGDNSKTKAFVVTK